MKVIEISCFSGTQYVNSETGKPLSPSELVEYKKREKAERKQVYQIR